MSTGGSEPAEFTGQLMRADIASGSKSEREALVLKADDGRVVPVRRRGGPAYGIDESVEGASLAALAAGGGSRVALTGTVLAGTLLADTWRPIGPPEEAAPDDPPE
ncbi:hypothetical protein OOK27_50425 [Streptomyces canus]|uniref:hypothetical protein n=1 Tax=Streptomyces canus TaxID=58343 RepID=UPI002255C313|nr:hypothetical protein [Streptomyces canus]MCX5262254.1 hypothetical protein [Streptomyces canus]